MIVFFSRSLACLLAVCVSICYHDDDDDVDVYIFSFSISFNSVIYWKIVVLNTKIGRFIRSSFAFASNRTSF
jgi:hypothetical protein